MEKMEKFSEIKKIDQNMVYYGLDLIYRSVMGIINYIKIYLYSGNFISRVKFIKSKTTSYFGAFTLTRIFGMERGIK